jgi:beta-galactosidase/beta-glucuronidase
MLGSSLIVATLLMSPQIKVEPALFYQSCDRLGLLVFQDMPSLRTQVPIPVNQDCKFKPVINTSVTDEFGRQLEILIKQHRSYPSIVTWVGPNATMSAHGLIHP